MQIRDALSLKVPIVWVTSDEPARAIDKVAQSLPEGEKIFRFDSLDNMVSYQPDKGIWLPVLIDDQPVTNPMDALVAALDAKTNFVIAYTKNIAESIAGLLVDLTIKWREAFMTDSMDELPARIILVSSDPEAPAEFRRVCACVEDGLPDAVEVAQIISHMSASGVEFDDASRVAKAAAGMAEFEFVSSALANARENGGKVEAKIINNAKVDLLKKNGVLEVYTPKLTINDLGGLDNAKKLIQQVLWTWKNPEKAKELGVTPVRRTLFLGLPGSGKSLMCEAIANALEVDLGKGGASNAMSKWVGESEQNMRRMFASLKRMAPIVFWIDEFGRDMSGSGSSGAVDGGTTDRVHGEFLTGLQQLPDDVFLAAAANRIEDLPPEMLRADRFDRLMFVGFPTEAERREIFEIHLAERVDHYDVDQLAASTAFFTGAEIKSLIKEVNFRVGTTEFRLPTTAEYVVFAPRVKGRMWVNHTEAITNMYRRAATEWDWASSGQYQEAGRVLQAANAKLNTGAPQPTTAGRSGGLAI